MRPAPGFADYRTPVRGLYHASSATHAGGGVNGIPGWQAFRQARKDRRLGRARGRREAGGPAARAGAPR
jgi:phytoene dehydrogenase-like protein